MVGAFAELQKLHEQWKELGPVAKEYRESIWERFKAATAVINKRYQAHFEDIKKSFAANLEAKEALCVKVEAIADKEDIKDAGQWNALSKEIEQIQADWKKIGFATRKDNQKIYERFRAACNKFYDRKKEFFATAKSGIDAAIAAREDLIAQAEALKTSTEWKKTTDQFISLQKQWKELPAVPRKKGEQLWKRFRAACDEFFAERDKNGKPENDFHANLKAKKALIAEIKAYKPKEGESREKARAENACAHGETGPVVVVVMVMRSGEPRGGDAGHQRAYAGFCYLVHFSFSFFRRRRRRTCPLGNPERQN